MKKINLKYIPTNYLIIGITVLYAIIQTKGNTIAWGALPLLFVIYKLFNKEKEKRNYTEELLIFISVLVLNFLAVYSFKYQSINLPHPDYQFYLKIANYFNELGIENSYTSKAYLFNEYSFSNPYRYFDTWLLSLLLRITPFSDLFTLQLIYKPILFFLVVNSINKLFVYIDKMFVRVLLSVVFIFFLGDSLTEYLTRGSNIGQEISVVSYPKLAIFFTLFIDFFRRQFFFSDRMSNEAICFIALLPILIQTSFPLYIFVGLYIILHYSFFINNKWISLLIISSITYFLFFYIYNSFLKNQVVSGVSVNLVKDSLSYLKRILSISYQFFFKKMFFIVFLLFMYFRCKENKKTILINIIYFGGIMFSGIIIYAFLPKTPNSYQLLTNLIYPCLIPLLFICLIWYSRNKKNKKYFLIIYTVMGMFGMYKQYFTSGFFNNYHEINLKNDLTYVQKVKKIFMNIDFPVGLTYWGDDFRNRAEHFDQHGLNFLVSIDGIYDVVCLTAINLNPSLEEDKFFYSNSSINYFNKKENNKSDNMMLFFNEYNFQFLFSDLDKNKLPDFIVKKIEETIFDPKSKTFFYRLK